MTNILPLLTKNSCEPVALLPPAPAVSPRWQFYAVLLALAGGLFGILGAAWNEFIHGDLLVAFVAAPIFEEVLKPSGLYILLAKWPRVLRTRLYTAMLAALGGLAFGIIESVLYVTVFITEPSTQLIIWRFTVCLVLHMVCSFIFGFGIDWKLAAGVRGQLKFLSNGKRFFIAAMALHSVYNILVTVFADKMGF